MILKPTPEMKPKLNIFNF